MATQFTEDTNPEDVLRASWLARLALGNYQIAPPISDKNTLVNPVFKKQAIELCD